MDPNMNTGMPPMGGDASLMGAPAAGDPNAMGMDPNAMGGDPADPNTMGGDPNAMGGDPNAMGGAPAGGDPNAMGGDPMNGSGNEGFDMGIGMTPEEDQKKWIEGAAAKLASELRKYQEGQPSPDMGLNKTAVNTVAAATKSNLQNGQQDELMKSYADTMRDGDEDNSDDSNGDFDDGDGNNTDDTPMDMGGDQNANADGSLQQMMEAKIKSIVNELVGDLTKTKNKPKPAAETEHDNEGSYTLKPFTRKK